MSTSFFLVMPLFFRIWSAQIIILPSPKWEPLFVWEDHIFSGRYKQIKSSKMNCQIQKISPDLAVPYIFGTFGSQFNQYIQVTIDSTPGWKNIWGNVGESFPGIRLNHLFENLRGQTPAYLEDRAPGLGYVVNNHGDRKSPKWGYGTPYKWPKWLINGGY